MSQDLLRRGYRPVTMPRDMLGDVLRTVVADKSAAVVFEGRAAGPIRDFVDSIGAALSLKGDPIEFWCTKLQHIYVRHILAEDWIARRGPKEDAVYDAYRVLNDAWTPSGNPHAGEINRGTYETVTVPEPKPERLSECGFRDYEHLERLYYPRDRIHVYSFANRSEMETYYLRGWCSVLAIAIHKRTGWPIVGVFEPWEERVPMHVACRAPDGSYVDARGTGQSLEELSGPYTEWPDCPPDVREMRLDQVLSCFRLHPHYHDLAENEHLDILLPDLERATAPAFA